MWNATDEKEYTWRNAIQNCTATKVLNLNVDCLGDSKNLLSHLYFRDKN